MLEYLNPVDSAPNDFVLESSSIPKIRVIDRPDLQLTISYDEPHE